jgi:ATP-dependent Clp protease adaptor protein ClpS
MSDERFAQSEGGVVLLDVQPKVKEPPLYQVYLLNDDYTPMEFVIEVLERFFCLSHDKATQIMLQVHTTGKGICGAYTRDVAETKVNQVNDYSRSHQQPLLCGMEAI